MGKQYCCARTEPSKDSSLCTVLYTLLHGLWPHCTENPIYVWHCTASFPIPAFMFLWAIYIFPGSVCLFAATKHECGNWETEQCNSVLEITRLRSFISGNTEIGIRHLYWILTGPSFEVHDGGSSSEVWPLSYTVPRLRLWGLWGQALSQGYGLIADDYLVSWLTNQWPFGTWGQAQGQVHWLSHQECEVRLQAQSHTAHLEPSP